VSISLAPDVAQVASEASDYAQRFADAAPRLSPAQAVLESERCLYCFDAPCATACPTHIDVPSFIRRIADGNLRGSARVHPGGQPPGRHVRPGLPHRKPV
jgi:dihydropyrimidine dehydrogenase (NAD+) subunit PreT